MAADDYGIQPRGYRLPQATTLGRVRLQIADLTRSLVYYEDVLGFRLLERAGDRATLGTNGDDDTPLIELHELPGARPVPQAGRLGLYHYLNAEVVGQQPLTPSPGAPRQAGRYIALMITEPTGVLRPELYVFYLPGYCVKLRATFPGDAKRRERV